MDLEEIKAILRHEYLDPNKLLRLKIARMLEVAEVTFQEIAIYTAQRSVEEGKYIEPTPGMKKWLEETTPE